MIQLGRYGAPRHTIAHLSDTHLLAGGRPLHGSLDTDATVSGALGQLERSGIRPDAIVITGDLTDLGEPDAYERLKNLIEPAAARMGSQLIWVMGNHDEREPFATVLLGDAPNTQPQDRVYDLDGLRIIVLDTTVPGYHHGDLDPDQLDWLHEQLDTAAPHGTLLALHHPPIPTPLELMAILELDHQTELADVIRDTDVRGILAGHLHYSTSGSFAGIPVNVASATCYTLDANSPPHTMNGVDGGQSFSLVHIYDDQIVHSVVPIGDPPQVAHFSDDVLNAFAAMTPHERREAFSNKRSTVTLDDLLRPRAERG
ncbi:phosphodiesterase [Homoserinibacter sp. GY 40078]|uniref:phosphodiesterase n=1 Tax=Homoserinibacter sp. GY 40078 TaxID=2603275 RepID=UPI0011CB3CAD|nr:phosphodiesterase [Homoserinibacter sp. GY 40078]TXK17045.1 phosphodiesterase [Homoserinibacter sp. GY 40078]